MRVSTSMIYGNGTTGIQNRQSDLYRIQNQLSTGRRILTPEDDPIASNEILKLEQSKGVNETFLDNQGNALSQLSYVDATLGSVTNELIRISELAAQAANPGYTNDQRGSIAVELRGRLESLVGLANTKDGTGLYLFAGFKSETQPFSVAGPSTPVPPATEFSHTNTYVSYSGDAGRRVLQVTASQEIPVSENGFDVFMQVRDTSGNPLPRSLFDSVQNLINNLSPSATYSATVQAQAQSDIRAGLNHVLNVRGAVGARQNTLETLMVAAKDYDLDFSVRLSDLRDLDYAEAISRFSSQQMQLEAAQVSFKKITQLSLFSIL